MTTLHLGDCLDILPTLADASVDAVISDPPYPCIDRSYGRLTEAQWFALMDPVVEQCRRILKPTGSAVFILQPNSERVGRMRTWLWEFMARWGREWGIVQDAWWWNTSALPLAGASKGGELMRSSLKACVWLGPADCHRSQDSVLWAESQRNALLRTRTRFDAGRESRPSIGSVNEFTSRARGLVRGGVTPFNVLPIPNCVNGDSAGGHGHGAGTPLDLADWWTRYICPVGGVVLDPFLGSGTMGIAAVENGCGFVGIERDPGYFAIAEKRIAAAEPRHPLFSS